jgi:hypothetical protein
MACACAKRRVSLDDTLKLVELYAIEDSPNFQSAALSRYL